MGCIPRNGPSWNFDSCWLRLVCSKIMRSVGKNLSWCALLLNFKKESRNDVSFLANLFRSSSSPFAGGGGGGFWGVTTSEIYSVDLPSWCIVDLWTCRAAQRMRLQWTIRFLSFVCCAASTHCSIRHACLFHLTFGLYRTHHMWLLHAPAHCCVIGTPVHPVHIHVDR